MSPSPPEWAGAGPERTGRELSVLARRRADYRRGRRRRSVVAAVASTAVVGAIVIWVVGTAPGWERARAAFFNGDTARDSLPAIAEGLLLNLQVWFVAGVAATVLGLVLAVVRTSRRPVLFPARVFAVVYVDVFRGVPLLLVLLIVGFGLPALRLPWLSTSGAFLGSLAIVLTYTAYLAEVFRSGIDAVHPAQEAAARSLGLGRGQALRYVVLPQALRNVTAPLASSLVSLQKDSGLISILGAVDAIRAAQIASTGVYNFTPYVVAGVLFLLVSIPLTRAVDAYSARGWRSARSTGAIR